MEVNPNRTAEHREVIHPFRPEAADRFPEVRERMFRLAYRMLWNRADAEDVVQETLALAFAKSHQLRAGAKWWPWVCRIVVTQCRWLGRRKLLRRRHETAWAKAFEGSSVQEGDFACDGYPRMLVGELVEQLPRRQREVMVLRHLEEMPYEEIASVLSMSVSTARVHARQGRERLLELLSQRHPGWVGFPRGGERP